MWIKLTLAAIWTSIMICYSYGDYFALYTHGVLEGMMALNTPFAETTPMLLLFFAISMAIPPDFHISICQACFVPLPEYQYWQTLYHPRLADHLLSRRLVPLL